MLSQLEANPPPASLAWAATNGHAKAPSLGGEREVERPVSPTGGEDNADGWLEVGKKNKVTVTRTVHFTFVYRLDFGLDLYS